METNIDDMNAELYAFVEAKLFDCGALDVYKTPIIMKKGRPAVKLSVLADLSIQDDILDVLFKETTSGGVRAYPVEKHMMKKAYRSLDTDYGLIQVKDYYHRGQCLKTKAEYEDCARAAKANDVSIKDVYDAVWKIEHKG